MEDCGPFRPLQNGFPPFLASLGHEEPGDPSPPCLLWYEGEGVVLPLQSASKPSIPQPWPSPAVSPALCPGLCAAPPSLCVTVLRVPPGTHRDSAALPQSCVVTWPHSHLIFHTSSFTTPQSPHFPASGLLPYWPTLPAPHSPSLSFLPGLSHFLQGALLDNFNPYNLMGQSLGFQGKKSDQLR